MPIIVDFHFMIPSYHSCEGSQFWLPVTLCNYFQEALLASFYFVCLLWKTVSKRNDNIPKEKTLNLDGGLLAYHNPLFAHKR